MKRKLHYYYGRFLKYVAEGRGMTTEKVDQVGRGRVFTGSQARGLGLIDSYGGIGEAIRLTKRRLRMGDDDEVRLLLLPKEDASLLARLASGLVQSRGGEQAPSAERGLLEALLPPGASRTLLKAIPGSVWAQPGVPQARLPFALLWED
jgi:protease-4